MRVRTPCKHSDPLKYSSLPFGRRKSGFHGRDSSRFACRDAHIPYELLKSSDEYELRLYSPRYVLETQYTKRDSAYILFDKYLTGKNDTKIKLESPAPVVMRHAPEGKLMEMFVMPIYSTLEKSALLNMPPTPIDPGLSINIAGGEVVAVSQFPGQATRARVEEIVEALRKSLEKSGIPLEAAEANGLFRVAQYDPVHSLRERKNEIWLAVKL